MPTPSEAFAQVAATLADIDPTDRQAVSEFYGKQFPKYSKKVQTVISEFVIGLIDVPTQEELSKLKSFVDGECEHD